MNIICTVCFILTGVCLGTMAGLALSESFDWEYQKIKVILSYAIPIVVFVLVFLIPTFWDLLR